MTKPRGILLPPPDELCEEDELRRADLLEHPALNGIDYVEIDPGDHRLLRVYFVKPLPPANPNDPGDTSDAYGIAAHPRRISITGGTRVTGIRTISATRRPDGSLEVRVDRPGDYSPYRLAIDSTSLDPFFRVSVFSFMAACPVDLDCPTDPECPPAERAEPAVDYLAKDYASFRRLLLDRLAQLDPTFLERSPADVGIALVELLAYSGDYLSYFQDAVANEAYLETARRRVSVRRLARLVDYRVHEGRNAWTPLVFTVETECVLVPPPAVTRVLSRISAPLRGADDAPGLFVDRLLVGPEAFERDPALASVVVFETAHGARLRPELNELTIHTWGNEECCLATGATEAFLYGVDRTRLAFRPPLQVGDRLLLEEVLGPDTGVPADAEAAHRQAVRVEAVDPTATDPLYSVELDADLELQRLEAAGPGHDPLPLLGVRWRREDALAFPLCLSSRTDSGRRVSRVSVARGNVVLADHGMTVADEGAIPELGRFRLRLERGPLTMACPAERPEYDSATGRSSSERLDLDCPPDETGPALAVLTGPGPSTLRELWTPVPDLLDSPPFERNVVAEPDEGGRALVRFGDGEYGRRPERPGAYRAVYRIGNGRAGNVGAEALVHLVEPEAHGELVGNVTAVRNPLPARGGVDPETLDEVRVRAPQAFRARQLRAVTESDYSAAARELAEVAGAVASFRWTGSWYTVFVGVDPRDPADLVNLPGGQTELASRLRERVLEFLEGRRLAGYDLEVRAPEFVPLELALDVCAEPDFFRADVSAAVRAALSSRRDRGGTRGFFHPDNFTFGQPVYLSRLYAAIERVPGVRSVTIRSFHRYGRPPAGELESGVLAIGPWQIARLDADPNFLEHGVLKVRTSGGKG
jgi:Baseplate J-like protein